jgi:hypothetical protein
LACVRGGTTGEGVEGGVGVGAVEVLDEGEGEGVDFGVGADEAEGGEAVIYGWGNWKGGQRECM